MGAAATLPLLMATLASISSLYDRAIVDTGRQPEFLFFVAFLVTFGFIRTSAHMIRAGVSWWPGNVEVGGTHIHHLVWGIVTMMITGYIGVTIAPPSPWHEIVAVFFGIGMGLALDEFALWLDLKDVYWSEQGRKSIDAVIIAATITGMILVGFTAWIDVAEKVEAIVFALVGAFGFVGIVATVVNLAKEKFGVATLGFLIPPIGIVAAFRLGRPRSLWARLFYSEDKCKLAQERFANGRRLPWRGRRREPASGQSAAGSG
jgi:lysyl-tRNA synthetase class 2